MIIPVRARRFAGTLALCAVAFSAAAQAPLSPEQFLGHQVGADYTLVPWPKIVEYFEHMAANTDRMNLRRLGETTEGRPFLLAEISSPDTIANFAPHKAAQRKIADPRLIENEEEERRLVHETKVPIVVNCQLHSTETAGSQMAMELAHELITGDSPQIREILEGTIILLIPCANPDGQVMVAEWYERSLGTPWEGTGMPWLYQKYAGHDNNRDWFMLNLVETRLTTQMLYTEWFPTIVWDVHQMSSVGPRLFVPPFHDPKNPNVHPVIDQTLLIIGGHMAGDLARKGMKGVVHGAIYDNWWAGGFRTTPYRHNMVGILTEMASVNGASPIFLRPNDLRGARRGLPQYEMTTNFPDPWPGGWWRLRDIVEYEISIAYSLFTLAARYHDMFQQNYIHFGREAIELGQAEPPFAWLVPPNQHDPRGAYEMLERLHATGIEVHQAQEGFRADGVAYPKDTFILYTAQPYRPHLMDMMERQQYPDREMYPGGPAEPPYDMAGWTLPLQMGVRHVEVSGAFEVNDVRLSEIPFPHGRIEGQNAKYYTVKAGHNDDYRLINRLYREEVDFSIYTAEQPATMEAGLPLTPGSIVIPVKDGIRQTLEEISADLSVILAGVEDDLTQYIQQNLTPARAPRVALYQPWTASMDEGWTRLILDNFEFEYANLHNAEVQAGNLRERYDCIIFPSIAPRSILDGRSPHSTAPEYTGGVGEKGLVALQDFVQQGGTLVCIDDSANLPIDHFNIPVHNLIRALPTSEFYCPGSVLRLHMDTAHPLGYGMPEWYSGYFARSQAFGIGANPNAEPDTRRRTSEDELRDPAKRFTTRVVSRYSDTVLLESGWIRGGELITDQPAIVEVEYGQGRIDLIAFGVQRRGQPHGTFRILFNAIQRSTL